MADQDYLHEIQPDEDASMPAPQPMDPRVRIVPTGPPPIGPRLEQQLPSYLFQPGPMQQTRPPMQQPPSPAQQPPPAAQLPPGQGVPDYDQYNPQLPRQMPFRQPFGMPQARPMDQVGGNWWPTTSAANYPGNEISPALPAPMEALGIFGRSGRAMQQWGSQGVGQYYGRMSQMAMQYAPILDAISKGAFSKNFLAARMGNLKMMEAEMQLNAEMGIERHKQELLAESEIFSAWKSGILNEQQAKEQLKRIAMQNGHQNLISVIDNLGMGAAENWIRNEDQHMRAIEAAWSSSTKSSKTGNSSLITDGGGEGELGSDARQSAQVQTPEIKPTGRDKTQADDLSAAVAKQFGLTDSGNEAARAIARGEQPQRLAGESANALDKVNAGAQAYRAAADRIATNKNLTPQDKINQIRDNVDPMLGDQLEAVRTFDEKLPAGAAGERMRHLIHSVQPGWHEGFYDIAKKYRDQTTSQGRVMTRVNSLATANLSVLAALKDLPENEAIPLRRMQAWLAGKITGDDKYARLYQAINNYAAEVAGIQRGTGTAPAYTQRSILEHMSQYSSPAQIRAQIKVDTTNAYSAIQFTKEQWARETGMGPETTPLSSPRSDGIFEGVMHMNTRTGEVPADAPNELRAVGRPGTGKPIDTPLTRDQQSDAKRFIQQYGNSSDPLVRAQVQRLRERLGITGVDY